MANRAIGPDGKYTEDFKEYLLQYKKRVAETGETPVDVDQLERDYNAVDDMLAAPLLRSSEMGKEDKREIRRMREKLKILKARQKIEKMAQAIKSQMLRQDLDDKVYQKLAIQFGVWKKQKTLAEANQLLDELIRDKYGGLERALTQDELEERRHKLILRRAEEEARRAKEEEEIIQQFNKKKKKKKKKRQKAKRKAREAALVQELSGPKSWDDYTDSDDDGGGGGEGKSREPVIPVSEEVAVPEVRDREMFFYTDPRRNPFIFTESKNPRIVAPLRQIVLITAPSGFFHDIPNSQIYDSFDDAFGNVLLIQRQSRDRVIIVFNDPETAENLIRQCNGGCTIKHPFEDKEIQFYVMPWRNTMEMERFLMRGGKTRRKKNRKKRTRKIN